MEGSEATSHRLFFLRFAKRLSLDVRPLSSHRPPHEVDGDDDEHHEGRADGHHGVHPHIDLLWKILVDLHPERLWHGHGGGEEGAVGGSLRGPARGCRLPRQLLPAMRALDGLGSLAIAVYGINLQIF